MKNNWKSSFCEGFGITLDHSKREIKSNLPVVEHAREHASGVAKLLLFPRQPPKYMDIQLDDAVGE